MRCASSWSYAPPCGQTGSPNTLGFLWAAAYTLVPIFPSMTWCRQSLLLAGCQSVLLYPFNLKQQSCLSWTLFLSPQFSLSLLQFYLFIPFNPYFRSLTDILKISLNTTMQTAEVVWLFGISFVVWILALLFHFRTSVVWVCLWWGINICYFLLQCYLIYWGHFPPINWYIYWHWLVKSYWTSNLYFSLI